MEKSFHIEEMFTKSKLRYFKEPLLIPLLILIAVALVFLCLQIMVTQTYSNCLQVNLNQNITISNTRVGVHVKISVDDDIVTHDVSIPQNQQTLNAEEDVQDECRRARLLVRRAFNISKETNRYINKLCEAKLKRCPRVATNIRIKLNTTSITLQMLNEDKYLNNVEKGGWWQPNHCIVQSKVAIIVPYRNREEHLIIFLRNIHQFLQKQNLHYRIFVIEQTDKSPFNRGKLLNVGYKEALKFFPFSCLVFHDVDLLPEDLRNFYGCLTSPQHLCVAIDKHDYKLRYEELFGGVEMFTKDDFELVNGLSSSFWGWGAEDDNLYKRLRWQNLQLWRQSHEIGRYKMLSHPSQETNGIPRRKDLLKESFEHFSTDGLSNLQYHVKNIVEKKLFTHISVDLRMERDKMFGIKEFPKDQESYEHN